MPFIQINVPAELSAVVKSKLIEDVIDHTHQAVGSDPAIINVVIHELPAANISVGGKTPHDVPAPLTSTRIGKRHG